jgi:ferredoxin-like protein FixX
MQAYQKFDSADFCAAKLRELIQNPAMDNPHALTSFNDFGEKYEFKTRTAKIIFNHSIFQEVDASIVIDACPVNILKENSKGLPVLAIEPEEAERGKCIECLACEFASLEAGIAAVKIELPIEGLDDVNSDR